MIMRLENSIKNANEKAIELSKQALEIQIENEVKWVKEYFWTYLVHSKFLSAPSQADLFWQLSKCRVHRDERFEITFELHFVYSE